MTDLDELVVKLRNFDLVENEARVYLTLLQKGPLKPSEIADISGVARAEVHRHLNDLEKKGFCVVVVERGKKYASINPSEALTPLVLHEESRRDEMIEEKSRIMSKWNASQRAVGAQNVELEKFQVIKDSQIAVERGIRMAVNCKKICRILLSRATIEESISSEILRVIESSKLIDSLAARRDLQLRLLLVSDEPYTGNLGELISIVESLPNTEVKWATSPILEALPEAVIADNDEILVSTSRSKKMSDLRNTERSSRTLVSNVSAMITPIIALFDQHWKNAEDFQPHWNTKN